MKSRINDIVLISLSTILITISAWIEIPFIVPFTLQILAIFIITGLFKFRVSFLSVVIYIIMGIIGIPVFSGFQGGIGVLMTYTGGFLLGFIFIPIVYNIINKVIINKNFSLVISFIISLIIIYLIGSIWFYIVYTNKNNNVNFIDCIVISVLPFIIPDVFKLFISIILINKLSNIIKNEAFN